MFRRSNLRGRPTTTPRAVLLGDRRREPQLPDPHRLVGDHVAALQQELSDIAEAELVSQAPQYGEQHDVGRALELVEGRAGALVESAPAGGTPEPSVSQRRPLPSRVHSVRSAVRTVHGSSSSQPGKPNPRCGPSFLTQPRAVGRATLDAIYPIARYSGAFPDQLAAGLEIHHVASVWMFASAFGSAYVDIATVLGRKIEARLEHGSQVSDPSMLRANWERRAESTGQRVGLSAAEAFTIIDLA